MCSGVCSAVSPSLCLISHSTLLPIYLSTPEGNWCSGGVGEVKMAESAGALGGTSHTHTHTHTHTQIHAAAQL